jgi:hypothetical protein
MTDDGTAIVAVDPPNRTPYEPQAMSAPLGGGLPNS